MMKKQIFDILRKFSLGKVRVSLLSFLLMATFFLASCDKGGGGSSSSDNFSSGVGDQTAYFVDAPVQGLEYETESVGGITDSEGAFKFNKGEKVFFSIGGLKLGSVSPENNQRIFPTDLTADGLQDAEKFHSNVIAVLQDFDSTAGDGIIVITEKLRNAWSQIDMDITADFGVAAGNAPWATLRGIAESKGGIDVSNIKEIYSDALMDAKTKFTADVKKELKKIISELTTDPNQVFKSLTEDKSFGTYILPAKYDGVNIRYKSLPSGNDVKITGKTTILSLPFVSQDTTELEITAAIDGLGNTPIESTSTIRIKRATLADASIDSISLKIYPDDTSQSSVTEVAAGQKIYVEASAEFTDDAQHKSGEVLNITSILMINPADKSFFKKNGNNLVEGSLSSAGRLVFTTEKNFSLADTTVTIEAELTNNLSTATSFKLMKTPPPTLAATQIRTRVGNSGNFTKPVGGSVSLLENGTPQVYFKAYANFSDDAEDIFVEAITGNNESRKQYYTMPTWTYPNGRTNTSLLLVKSNDLKTNGFNINQSNGKLELSLTDVNNNTSTAEALDVKLIETRLPALSGVVVKRLDNFLTPDDASDDAIRVTFIFESDLEFDLAVDTMNTPKNKLTGSNVRVDYSNYTTNFGRYGYTLKKKDNRTYILEMKRDSFIDPGEDGSGNTIYRLYFTPSYKLGGQTANAKPNADLIAVYNSKDSLQD